MIPKKVIQSYLDEHWDKLNNHLEQYYLYQEPNDLHQLRVNIKKISALVQLLGHDQDIEQIKKAFEPIRKIFKAAGIIRETQILLELTKKLEFNYPWVTKILEKRKNQATKYFLKSKKRFQKTLKHEYPKWCNQITSLPDFILRNFLLTQIKSAELQLSKQNYHEARKKIKVALNLASILPDNQKASLNIEYLDKIQEVIGDWHDADENFLVFEKLMLRSATLDMLKKEADKQSNLMRQQLIDFRQKVFNSGKTA